MTFDKYYTDQANSNLPVFRGANYQRGYGFGNVFKNIFRWIIPLVKEHAKPIAQKVGKEALKTATNIATDAINGKDLKSSAQSRIEETLSKIPTGQFGNGSKKHYKKKRNLPYLSKQKKKRKLDIFDNIGK